MQISRHWRLNAQRYRLEMPVYSRVKEYAGVPAFEEISGQEQVSRDHRLLGAMAVFYDEDHNIFLLPDEAKQESVGFAEVFDHSLWAVGRYGLPAGGQQGNETMQGTLLRELKEELPAIDTYQISRQNFTPISPYPFVVNQLKNQEDEVIGVNQITVVAAGMEICRDSSVWHQLQDAGAILWPASDLARHFDDLLDADLETTRFSVRPQVVVAAACLVRELTTDHLIGLNNISVHRGYRLAGEHDVQVYDGAICHTGRVNPALTFAQKEYLGIS